MRSVKKNYRVKKPIFVIKFGKNFTSNRINENENLNMLMQRISKDYHVISYIASNEIENISFDFYPGPHSNKDAEKLKAKIESIIYKMDKGEQFKWESLK